MKSKRRVILPCDLRVVNPQSLYSSKKRSGKNGMPSGIGLADKTWFASPYEGNGGKEKGSG